MPVVEDGLSDSENVSTDEHSPRPKLPVLTKATQIDLNHSSSSSTLPCHKHQHTKSNNLPVEPPTMPVKPHAEDSSIIPTGKSITMKPLQRK